MNTSPKDATSGLQAAIRDPIWIESTGQKDAARAIEMVHVQLISAVIDPYSWKWVMGTLAHAAQAFLVATLADAHPAESQETADPSAGEWFTATFSSPRDPVASDALPELYARVKVKTGYRPAPRVDEDLARLADFRHTVMRGIPCEWKLRVNELPRVTRNVLGTIEFLGWNPGHIAWHKETLTDLARIKLLASMKVLDALDGQYRH